MKILVPTDFSKLSKVAVNYAANLAKDIKAEIILLNVIYIDAPPRALAAFKTQQVLDAITENATEDLISLTNEIKKKAGKKIKVGYNVVKGYPVENTVEAFARHNNIDLIIIGTKGASGLKKVLMGSNAAAVIGASSVPVMCIPEHARYRGIKHMVYASDLRSIKKETKTIFRFARLFNASIHILHSVLPSSKKKIDTLAIKSAFIKKYKYKKVSVQVSVNEDVKAAINDYTAKVRAGLLVMFTHRPTFFERVFGKSITREMAFFNRIPLLAIKK